MSLPHTGKETPTGASRAKLIASRSLNIPTLPAVVQKVRELLADPKTGTLEIGKFVAQDPPLAAKVLKIANSAYYGLRERCVSTEQACAVLGLRVLRNVILQAAVMSRYEHMEGQGMDLDQLWQHSQLVGQVAQQLARRARAKLGLTPEEIHACGLLHDLGKVVLLESLREEYLPILRRARVENVPMHVCEEQALGFNHTDVGSLVAIQWGLPTAVASGIQFHHGPREAVATDPIVCLVANANLVVHRAAGGNPVAAADTLDAATQRFLGIEPEHVNQVVEALMSWMGGARSAA